MTPFRSLVLVVAESALERVPEELRTHPDIKRFSEKTGIDPKWMVLDRSYHHHAMRRLKDSSRRGRPDIVHYTLLSILETPLCWEGFLEVYVHTYDDYVMWVNPEVRLPRNHLRFQGLLRQLFRLGRVPPGSKIPLLEIRKESFKTLIEELKPSKVVGLSEDGAPKTLSDLALELIKLERPTVVLGGFPHGGFREATRRFFDETICIDPKPLNTWIVASRLVYSFEKALGVEERRVEEARMRRRNL